MPLYDTIGHGYAARRKPDPRIAALIHAALGDAVSIANIGAGTGSYKPADREVIAIEPSKVMIRHARLLDLDELDLGYRLAVCNLARN